MQTIDSGTTSPTTPSKNAGVNWPLLQGLILNVGILALQWTTVAQFQRDGHYVLCVFAFMAFFGTFGMSLKIWFYAWLMLMAVDVLAGEDTPPPNSPASAWLYVPWQLLRWAWAVALHLLRGFALIGGLVAVLAFVGYKGWWAFGVVALAGAVAYALIELQNQRGARS